MSPKLRNQGSPSEERLRQTTLMQFVGLPNVGNRCISTRLPSYPYRLKTSFCTIEPNEARVNVPDERFEWLCQLYKPKSENHDIAGLVRGAHEGQRLGNNFLSHICAVDGIFHVLRAFEDPDIIHVDDSVDPVRDLKVITAELRLKDLEFMERRIEDLEKSMKRSNDKQLKIELELCLWVCQSVSGGKICPPGGVESCDIEILNTFQLLTAKPVVYLVSAISNIIKEKRNKFLPKIHAWVQEHSDEIIIPFSCVLERTLADMPPDEAAKYCKENKVQRHSCWTAGTKE
ncbi:hypothetical protein Pfo_012588 [Paulownia fortunei]|nr:hypothetical protein Pfo_012588 [Paulownia fortunei]